MAIGGPVSVIGGVLEGFSRNRQRSQSRINAQLNEALRLQKEDRENKEAVAKEGLARDKAKAQFDQAASELALIEQRRAQIMASPGKPFRDATLEGALEKARERMADARAAVQESQSKLQGLMEDRDARIRAAIPRRQDKGWFSSTDLPPEKQFGGKGRSPEQVAADKAAIVKGERGLEGTPEGREFRQDYRQAEGEIRRGQGEESRERGNIGAAERSLEVGRSEQGPQNEETRNKELFPLDKQASELRSKQVESQAAMAAAAQEIQARQQQQAALQAMPGYGRAMQGGAATGKGGGGGGLLGAIFGKGGGMGAPAAQGGPAPSPGPAGVGPTVGQAIGPALGKIAQMPVNQVMQSARQLVGGALGSSRGGPGAAPQGAPPGSPQQLGPGGAVQQGNYRGQPYTYQTQPALAQAGQGGGAPIPPQRPRFDPSPQNFAGPRRPVYGQPSPAAEVGGRGQGGGLTPEVQRTAGTPTLSQVRDYVYAQAPKYGIDPRVAWDRVWAKEGGNTGVYNGPGGAPGSGFYATNQNDGGHSLGAFQLYDKGEGALFKQKTGQSINPQNAFAQADFSLQEAAKKGWTPWHAAANTGVGQWEGINRGGKMAGGTLASKGVAESLPSTTPTSSGVVNQEQGTQRKQPAMGQQAQASPKPPPLETPPDTPSPPIDIKPFAPPPAQLQSPQGMGMQTYGGGGQQGGLGGKPQDIGPPLIHSPEQMKGLKPGSLIRLPDGSLRVVPLVEARQ